MDYCFVAKFSWESYKRLNGLEIAFILFPTHYLGDMQLNNKPHDAIMDEDGVLIFYIFS